MQRSADSKAFTSGTKLALVVIIGGVLLALIALKYRTFEPAEPTTPPTTQSRLPAGP